MNSDQFPKATFNGAITNLSDVNLSKDGTYTVQVEGELSIRGAVGAVKTPATIVIKNGVISATANFSIKLSDYGIEGTPINAGKVSKEPTITVSAELK
jgi:polyisoprenoid-binding protein YceI